MRRNHADRAYLKESLEMIQTKPRPAHRRRSTMSEGSEVASDCEEHIDVENSPETEERVERDMRILNSRLSGSDIDRKGNCDTVVLPRTDLSEQDQRLNYYKNHHKHYSNKLVSSRDVPYPTKLYSGDTGTRSNSKHPTRPSFLITDILSDCKKDSETTVSSFTSAPDTPETPSSLTDINKSASFLMKRQSSLTPQSPTDRSDSSLSEDGKCKTV